MRIALTGHRPNKLGNDYDLKGPLCQAIRRELFRIIREYQPEQMISGMALGCDTIWAELAVNLGIDLLAYIPFEGQGAAWPRLSRERYERLLRQASEVVTVCEGAYGPWMMQRRNERMVDDCDMLVAVWDGTPGGTGNCMRYAEIVGKRIVRIDPRFLLKQD